MNFQVTTVLSKVTPKGNTSTWQFGRLANGWYGGKSLTTGQKQYYPTPSKMQAAITRFVTNYGYAAPLPSDEQLCLPL
jgi:hypothetical protein